MKKRIQIFLQCAAILFSIVCIGCQIGWYKNKKERTAHINTEAIVWNAEEYTYRDSLINILILGIDKEEVMWERDDDGNSVGQADSIFILSLDTQTKEIRLIAVPRDTVVPLKMYNVNGEFVGGRPGQIALQYAYADGQQHSCQLMVERVSEILGDIPIYGYLALNLSTIPIINDAVGGVTVTMDADYTLFENAFTEGATVHLDGVQALRYLQNRDITIWGSALTRIDRHKVYLKAFIQQAKMAVQKDQMLPFRVLRMLDGNYETDLTWIDMIYLLRIGLNGDWEGIKIWTLPGEIRMGSKWEEYVLEDEALFEGIMETFYRRKLE